MQPFISHSGRIVALRRDNIDTDQIIPKQFLKRIERSGLGPFLFHDWRYHPDGSENLEFVLNRPEARGASVLLTGANFGCGSSREHAPWALADFGFRVLLASSFADIFFINCCQNGLLPVVLGETVMRELFLRYEAGSLDELTVDLRSQSVRHAGGFELRFEIDPYRRDMLMRGLDEIGLTLLQEQRIAAFERRRAPLSAAKSSDRPARSSP